MLVKHRGLLKKHTRPFGTWHCQGSLLKASINQPTQEIISAAACDDKIINIQNDKNKLTTLNKDEAGVHVKDHDSLT